MSEPRWARHRFEYTVAERLWLEANFDEVQYLKDVEARILAKRRGGTLITEFDPSAASEAERAMHPEQNW